MADAGEFSGWLRDMQAAIRGERDADVPCDGCTACCTSYQFVHIAPDETDTLARVPRELLFAAPGLPDGHVVLGYDERGHCPMLFDGRCSIYAHRPRTCRAYDCRVFAATGIAVDDGDATKVEIARRVETWEFRIPTDADVAARQAVSDAVGGGDGVPGSPTQRAVAAVMRAAPRRAG